ncbi:purine-cytosine transporter [Aestuariicella hydrocarbonica]|uniref:Purine-cytosine transporter n=1 Tax=Pseudomaricurvus hydrocarbonicus TaxID=1470433 RepID=A0A9E5JV70_9GAMM|nr:cytosine permease [Aestuariicella hydrocarbonica]NHO65160.1 purine-cytosine transporter [Aestuariicella hydrocarbonica]
MQTVPKSNTGKDGGSWLSRLSDQLGGDEDHGPIKGTLSTGRIGMIWLAANLVVTTLLTGTLFVPGVSWPLAIGLIVLGSIVGGVVLVLVGNMGTRTGLSTMSLTKGAFGLRGSLLTTAANVVILMGWCWVQAMLAGVTVNYLVEGFTGYSNPILFSVMCQFLVVCLAIFGHKGIEKIEPWLGLVIFLIMLYIFYTAFTTFSPSAFINLPVDKSLGWNGVSVLDVVIATVISWTVLSAEMNRLAKSQKAGVVGSGVGYLTSTIMSMGLGATAIAYVVLSGEEARSFDPTMIVSAFGAPLAIVIFLSVMATNTMVVYGMVSSVVGILPGNKVRFLPAALVLGTVSLIGSSWLAMLDQFTSFLTLVGSLFVPVFAIMIVDYYLVHKRVYDHDILLDRGGKYWYQNGIHYPAIIIWAIGIGVSMLLTHGLVSPLGATIPTFAITFLLYLGWSWLTKAMVTLPTAYEHLSTDQ